MMFMNVNDDDDGVSLTLSPPQAAVWVAVGSLTPEASRVPVTPAARNTKSAARTIRLSATLVRSTTHKHFV